MLTTSVLRSTGAPGSEVRALNPEEQARHDKAKRDFLVERALNNDDDYEPPPEDLEELTEAYRSAPLDQAIPDIYDSSVGLGSSADYEESLLQMFLIICQSLSGIERDPVSFRCITGGHCSTGSVGRTSHRQVLQDCPCQEGHENLQGTFRGRHQ